MAEKIPMLALSPTMEEGAIVKWIKKEGDQVAESDVLCEVETDKATMEYESPAEGTLLKIVAAEGSSAKVGDTIAIVGEEGEDVSGMGEQQSAEQPAKEPAKEPTEEPTEEPAEKQPEKKQEQSQPSQQPQQEKARAEEQPQSKTQQSGRVKSSPLARKVAEQKGIDITQVQGTGPEGRIIVADIEKAAGSEQAQTQPAKQPQAQQQQMPAAGLTDTEEKVSGKRKVIADRLSSSKFSAPHYYLKTTVLADALIGARQAINKQTGGKVSLNAYIMKFTAEALKRHPIVNATWADDKIIKHGSVDIALAVALDDGLITPVVRGCENKGVLEIDGEIKVLIEKAKSGTLKNEEYNNSTFTITNLGSFGIEEFTAIINPPNSAILAVGRALREPVVDENDNVNVRTTMKLTLSCDHRIIDGAVGAQFLGELKGIIEYPVYGML